MFRDRTNLYISYRRTYPHHSDAFGKFSRFDIDEEENLIGGGVLDNGIDNGVNLDHTPLPPTFLDTAEEIDEVISEVMKLLDKLNGLYKKNLLPSFNDRSLDEEEIEKLNFTITNRFFKCDNLVKKFSQNTGAPLKQDDLNIIDNMQKSYALKIQNLSSNFRKLQNNYIKFLKKDEFEKTPNNLKLTKTDSSYNPALAEETEEMESYSREAIRESSSILQQSSNINDTLIRQREQEITKLAQGVLEVSRIFKDMQNMVIDQGTILDRIDYNIENTKVDLQGAQKELTKATHYQKRTQKCKLILLLSLVVMLLFMIVILKPHRHVGGGGPKNNNNKNNNHNNNNDNDNDHKDIPEKDKTPVTVDHNEGSVNIALADDTIVEYNRFNLV
jgi:syntaxin 16